MFYIKNKLKAQSSKDILVLINGVILYKYITLNLYFTVKIFLSFYHRETIPN
jgi:hypothetical protein